MFELEWFVDKIKQNKIRKLTLTSSTYPRSSDEVFQITKPSNLIAVLSAIENNTSIKVLKFYDLSCHSEKSEYIFPKLIDLAKNNKSIEELEFIKCCLRGGDTDQPAFWNQFFTALKNNTSLKCLSIERNIFENLENNSDESEQDSDNESSETDDTIPIYECPSLDTMELIAAESKRYYYTSPALIKLIKESKTFHTLGLGTSKDELCVPYILAKLSKEKVFLRGLRFWDRPNNLHKCLTAITNYLRLYQHLEAISFEDYPSYQDYPIEDPNLFNALSSQTELRYLYFHCMTFLPYEGLEKLLMNTNKLKEFYLSGILEGDSDDTYPRIINAIAMNHTLETLELTLSVHLGYEIQLKSISQKVVQMILTLPNLKRLKLQDLDYDEISIEPLAQLKNHPSLTEFYMGRYGKYSKVTSVWALAELLSNPNLQIFRTGAFELRDEHLIPLLWNTLKSNNCLKILDFTYSSISDHNLEMLADVISEEVKKGNCLHLRAIHLSSYNCTPNGERKIKDVLNEINQCVLRLINPYIQFARIREQDHILPNEIISRILDFGFFSTLKNYRTTFEINNLIQSVEQSPETNTP